MDKLDDYQSKFDEYGKYLSENNDKLINISDNDDRELNIVLFGVQKSGKSSTINRILKNTVCDVPTVDTSTDRREILQFKLEQKSSNHRQHKVNLIESPGFEDDRGHKQDARNLSQLQNFLQNQRSLPNNNVLVLITCSATDKRYDDEYSPFVQMLKSLKRLEIVDEDRPNVVVIITNCCSHGPNYVLRNEDWRDEIDRFKSKIIDLTNRYLNITCSAVILENNFVEERFEKIEMMERYHSEMCTRLPNEEIQPLNLLSSCLDVLVKKEDDNIGALSSHFYHCFVVKEGNVDIGSIIVRNDDEELDDENYKAWLQFILDNANVPLLRKEVDNERNSRGFSSILQTYGRMFRGIFERIKSRFCSVSRRYFGNYRRGILCVTIILGLCVIFRCYFSTNWSSLGYYFGSTEMTNLIKNQIIVNSRQQCGINDEHLDRNFNETL